MNSAKISSLKKSYSLERTHLLTEEQFGSLVLFFPSLLIIASDGEVDEEEWVYVNYLSKFIADTFKEEIGEEKRDELEAQYLLELTYLINNLDTWEKPFLDTLQDYINFNSDVKEDVEDILYLFAEASDGKSEEEEQKIEELRERLQIA
jgi:hypothetical protein